MYYIEKTRCEKVIEGGNLDFLGHFCWGKKCKDSKEFMKQKKDARNTLKAISKMLSNVTFKNRDKQ